MVRDAAWRLLTMRVQALTTRDDLILRSPRSAGVSKDRRDISDTLRRSRGADASELSINTSLNKKRARGMPGAQPAPI